MKIDLIKILCSHHHKFSMIRFLFLIFYLKEFSLTCNNTFSQTGWCFLRLIFKNTKQKCPQSLKSLTNIQITLDRAASLKRERHHRAFIVKTLTNTIGAKLLIRLVVVVLSLSLLFFLRCNNSINGSSSKR